jgi:hypothetical protein
MYKLESIRARYTHFSQDGRGFQSQADRPAFDQPGSELATIDQPQIEIVARQGKFTHRLWVPVDVVTAASPDAVDAVSTASRTNEAGTFDISHAYDVDRRSAVGLRYAFHLEEPFRSWQVGVFGRRSFADDNTTISASINQIFDWVDRFNIFGARLGRAYRSSTNGNVGVTQLLSPTTVGFLGYGVTVQLGELSNTWNAVPLDSKELGREILPGLRHRHAFVARISQALPWKGIIKGLYRFYVDNWNLLAHTIEAQLYQRFSSWLYLRASYRFHTQTAPYFWTTLAAATARERSADSDLAEFNAQTFGILAGVDIRFTRGLRDLHLDFGYERYTRTNGLDANIYTCSLGFRF